MVKNSDLFSVEHTIAEKLINLQRSLPLGGICPGFADFIKETW